MTTNIVNFNYSKLSLRTASSVDEAKLQGAECRLDNLLSADLIVIVHRKWIMKFCARLSAGIEIFRRVFGEFGQFTRSCCCRNKWNEIFSSLSKTWHIRVALIMLLFCPTCSNLLLVEYSSTCLRLSCRSCKFSKSISWKVVLITFCTFQVRTSLRSRRRYRREHIRS